MKSSTIVVIAVVAVIAIALLNLAVGAR